MSASFLGAVCLNKAQDELLDLFKKPNRRCLTKEQAAPTQDRWA